MEQIVEEFKNAVSKNDLSFDCGCYVYDQLTNMPHSIVEMIETETEIQFFYDELDTTMSTPIDDVWAFMCSADMNKPVIFIHREQQTRKVCIVIDDCLSNYIEFNVW